MCARTRAACWPEMRLVRAFTFGPSAAARAVKSTGFFVLPSGLVGGIGEQGEHGKVHVLAVGEFVFHFGAMGIVV